jgi:hypothetical protein
VIAQPIDPALDVMAQNSSMISTERHLRPKLAASKARSLTASVHWMPGVERPAVETNVFSITERFDLFFRAIVAMLAQRLKGACKELGTIAAVRLNVVGDRGRHGDALLQAEDTKRIDHKLVRTYPLPTTRAV